ncbi:MAG: hypothetical protein EXS42_04565 [Lacunisphaera sp.]|nr:hypothetical protein [Lacunisphaera sp.]
MAPKGWHVASGEEWLGLMENFGGEKRPGPKLNIPAGGRTTRARMTMVPTAAALPAYRAVSAVLSSMALRITGCGGVQRRIHRFMHGQPQYIITATN